MADAPAQTRERPERLSMSFIRAAQGCLRRADLERDVEVAGLDAVIGRVFHDVAAAVGFACSMRGHLRPAQGEPERIARNVLAALDVPVPKAAQDVVVDMVGWWAPRAEFRLDEQFEINSRVDLDGRTLSARIDRLAIVAERDGWVAYVNDYKTGWAGAQKSIPVQGEVYGWHAFHLAPHIDRVIYSEDHVRTRQRGGPWELTRDHLPGIERFLQASIELIDGAYDQAEGELPATPGSACSSPTRCPVAGSCPVPRWARPATSIESEDDAVAQFEQLLVMEAQQGEVKDELRGWIDGQGARALVHNGEEIGYSPKPGKRFDKKRLAADLAACRGEEVDLADYETTSKPPFGRRKAVDE